LQNIRRGSTTPTNYIIIRFDIYSPLLWWMSMCKLNIGLEVEFLPVYQPSEEEIEDPCLFASNVQKVMADALGVCNICISSAHAMHRSLIN